MTNDVDEKAGLRPLSTRYQLFTLAAFAVVAALSLILLVLNSASGQSSGGQTGRPVYFVPTGEQAAAMRLVKIGLYNFRDETITDGYVAANGGWRVSGTPADSIAPGVPVLAGQSSDLLQAESDLVAASAQLRTARATEERQHKLFEAEGAALKDWQQSQTDLTAAAASFETARNKLRVLGKSDREILSILSSARAAGPSPGKVFAIGGPSLVWLVANVREADAVHVHQGDLAEVRVAALPDRLFRLRIGYLSEAIDPATHRLAVAAICRNEDGALKPNMQATFDISERAGRMAPAVPETAVIHEGDQARVWVVDREGRYFQRAISAGRSQAGYVEVRHGVSAGETVVAGGALFVDQEQSGN
ncbi:MAG TPA: efflux RND transporter periplasmic adaptor subunit [Rhizomicrobium sp.]|nr:efflux RND transporter periplasmic adaptor subunit [Rhizomicrobium sp.]